MKVCNLVFTPSPRRLIRCLIARSSGVALSATSVSEMKASKMFFSSSSSKYSLVAASESNGMSVTVRRALSSLLATRNALPTLSNSAMDKTAPFFAFTMTSSMSSTAKDGLTENSKSTLSASAVRSSA